MKTRLMLLALLLAGFAVPSAAVNYKNKYPDACNDVWAGVKQVLANPDNYTVKTMDEAKMHADYEVKHSVHVTITGALWQGTNHVTLVSKPDGCEMRVDSRYSGFEHNDQGDFKKRVDDAMVALKAAKPQPPVTTGEVK